MFDQDKITIRESVDTTVAETESASAPVQPMFLDRYAHTTKRIMGDALDSKENAELHHRLIGHYYSELDRQGNAREEMSRDEQYYDNDPWDPMDKWEIEERGQKPISYNVIATVIDWVLGTQMTSPTDYAVHPRRKEGREHARRKQALLKYVSDQSYGQDQWSLAFEEMVKAGLSWMECGTQSPENGEIIYERMESWRNVVWDSANANFDMRNARYLFRTRWVDADLAKSLFPERAGIIDASMTLMLGQVFNTDSTFGLDMMGDHAMDSREMGDDLSYYSFHSDFASVRNRVRIVEGWYRDINREAMIIEGGDFSGELFDPKASGHMREIESGRANIVQRPAMCMHVAIFTDTGLLFHGPTPYRHNRFPLTPIYAKRRSSDGMPYGMIRQVRDVLDSLNKRASKVLHILNTRRLYIEEGSVEDIDATREEVARPDATIVYKQGYNAPVLESDLQYANAQMQYFSNDMHMVQSISGVTDENLGRNTNAHSGKAIIARQTQGSMTTAYLFSHLRKARKEHGEKLLSLIEQFYTKEKVIRITGDRGIAEFISFNTDDDEEDDAIAETKADFVLGDDEYTITQRQNAVEQLVALLRDVGSTDPRMTIAIIDLVVEMMDVPKAGEIVKRIRQVTGMRDPDADPNNPDAETVEQMQAQQQQQQLEQRLQEANISLSEAKAAEAAAKAKVAAQEVSKRTSAATQDEIKTIMAAFDAAMEIIASKPAAPVASALLKRARQIAEANAAGQVTPDAPPQDQMPQQLQNNPPQNIQGTQAQAQDPALQTQMSDEIYQQEATQ